MKNGPDGAWQTDYHGYYAKGTPHGASYLYWVASAEDSGRFERYLEDRPGAVDLWFGGHTHTNSHDERGGKSHIETRYGGTTFIDAAINAAAPTRCFVRDRAMPDSRVPACRPGSRAARIRCSMPTAAHRRTPPGRPVRGEGAPDNARQTLYLGGVRGHLVGRRHIWRYIAGRRSRPWATGATRA